MDNGHYHPTEVVSDKISSLLLFNEKIALHVTRAVRWDSDHVVILDDETKEIAKEIVRNNALDRVFIATDYFDASINRISAWVTGVRSVQKALLFALLQPSEEMKKLQDESNFTDIMYLSEEMKMMPLLEASFVNFKFDPYNSYSFVVEKDGVSSSYGAGSTGKHVWTPEEAGTYTITAQFRTYAGAVYEKQIAYQVYDSNEATVYYSNSSWTQAYIHYQVENGSWTSVPGVKMADNTNGNGYTWKYVIDLGTANKATVCFNNGNKGQRQVRLCFQC